MIPVYNTRDGERKEFFRAMAELTKGFLDRQPGAAGGTLPGRPGRNQRTRALILGEAHVLQQCAEFLAENFPDTSLMATHNLENDLAAIRRTNWPTGASSPRRNC